MIKKIAGIIGIILFLVIAINAFNAERDLRPLQKYFDEAGEEMPTNQEINELAAEFAIWGFDFEREQIETLVERMREYDESLGFSVVTRYKTNLASSMTSTQTTVPTASITSFDGTTLTFGLLGTNAFLTIEPGSSREEIVKCTAISSTSWITCTRGLGFTGTSTAAVTANKKAHNAGSTVVMSNVHYVYDELVDKEAAETIAGIKTFSSFPITPSSAPTSAYQVANKAYADAIALTGSATSTESVTGGNIQLATAAEAAAGTASSTSGAAKVLLARTATSTPGDLTGNYVVVTNTSSKIEQEFLDLSDSFAFTAAVTMSSTLGVTATVTAGVASTTSIFFDDAYITSSAAEINKLDGTSANVTAANLNTMTAGATSDATSFHYHGTQCDVGQGDRLDGATGTQVISHNLGVTPSYYSFNMVSTVVGSSNQDPITASGVATSTSVTQSSAWGGEGLTSATTTGAVMYGVDHSANVDITAILSAESTTTFTLNWTVNAAESGNIYRVFTWTACK